LDLKTVFFEAIFQRYCRRVFLLNVQLYLTPPPPDGKQAHWGTHDARCLTDVALYLNVVHPDLYNFESAADTSLHVDASADRTRLLASRLAINAVRGDCPAERLTSQSLAASDR